MGTIPAIAATICVVVGIRALRRDQRGAYTWFERAVLIDLLLTQPFAVAADWFSALPSIVIDLVILAAFGAAKSATRAATPAARLGRDPGRDDRDGPEPASEQPHLARSRLSR